MRSYWNYIQSHDRTWWKLTWLYIYYIYIYMNDWVTLLNSRSWHNICKSTILQQKNYQQITNAGEGVEKRVPSHTVGGNVNWYNHYGKQYGGTLENYIQNYHMTQHSHSWAYIWTKQLEKDPRTRMFIAALLTIAKTRKKPRCPLTDEWIKNMRILEFLSWLSS